MAIDTDRMVKLESRNDTRSFLVPCYGFETANQAIEYAAGPWLSECRIFGEEDAYAPIFWGTRSYVARVSAGYNRYSTDVLVGGSEPRIRACNPIWEMLRSKDTVKPAGAYNVALLVAGKRQFYRHHRQTTKHPKWWYRISDGRKDCYAVWARRDGAEIKGAMFDDGDRQVFAVRSGRGAIYSREILFDNRGEPGGWLSELVLVEFSILDRDPAKDDMLWMRMANSTKWSDDPERLPSPHAIDVLQIVLDDVWGMLWDQAVDGFELNCQPVPKQVEAWRKFFLEQRAKAETDRRLLSASFAERVKEMNWQEALRQVEEPWQLEAVISAHAHRPEFYVSPGYPGATYNNVQNMLGKHDCTEGRREALWKMVSDYVEPCDNLWDYTGD